jgi:hypothetical protein
MIQRRLLYFVLTLLLVFAQQQAIVHPYVHLANGQESSTSDKQAPAHSETCGKCIAFAGVSAAVSSQALTIAILPTAFERSVEIAQPLLSTLHLSYHSRAPPYLA